MPLLDVFFSMLWFFLFIAWIWLLITVIVDIFRSDMSGWSKALWALFVVVLPFLGVFIYLIVHGGDMQNRAVDDYAKQQQAQTAYIQSAAGTSSADQLAQLADLHSRGVLTDQEYAQQKQKVLDS